MQLDKKVPQKRSCQKVLTNSPKVPRSTKTYEQVPREYQEVPKRSGCPPKTRSREQVQQIVAHFSS